MFTDDIFKNAEGIAYICDGHILTYDELLKSSMNMANFLKTENSPVVVYGHKSPLMIICFMACLAINRAYIPCDSCTPKDRIEEILKLSNAGCILCTEDLFIDGIKCIDAEEIMSICYQKESHDFLNCNINMDSNAYIIFTSGSSGKPKGVKISYNNLQNFIDWMSQISAIKEIKPKVILNQAVFSFDLSVADMYYALVNGGVIYALTREFQQDYRLLFKALRESKAEMAVMTPSFADMCLCDSSFNDELMPKLKIIFFCGEVLKPSTVNKLFNRFNGIKIINAYGPTEATCAVSCVEITREMISDSLLPVGEVNSSAVDVVVENDEVVTEGEKGQIMLRGKSVSSGYLGVKSQAFTLTKEGACYYTGDIGYIKNNLIYLMGRKDDMIKLKGYRIEPGDVENNLLKIEGIKQAVVTVKCSDDGSTRSINAYICSEENFDKSTIREKAREYLPGYMIPKIFNFVENIPLNSNGKIDKSKLI